MEGFHLHLLNLATLLYQILLLYSFKLSLDEFDVCKLCGLEFRYHTILLGQEHKCYCFVNQYANLQKRKCIQD